MIRFTQLYRALDATTRTTEKVRTLADYFRAAEPADAAWALWFLLGNRLPRAVTSTQLRAWAAVASGLPDWLMDECYEAVGDLAETLALVLPSPTKSAAPLPLHELVAERIAPLKRLPPEEQRALVARTWSELTTDERFLWHKLMLGGFRIGVARTLVARALAQVAQIPPEKMAHRLLRPWKPSAADFAALLDSADVENDPGQPYPFFLATTLDEPPETLGEPNEWQIEWKWDGIRAQLIRRAGEVLVWSRGEELLTDRFPEAAAVGRALPEGTVLDGEILAWRGGAPLPFQVLQTRIGRKAVTAKALAAAPVVFLAYDLLEWAGQDMRARPLTERRALLEAAVAPLLPQVPFGEAAAQRNKLTIPLRLSPVLTVNSWDEVTALRDATRENLTEGVMLKRRDSPYAVGRPRGDWWKWKSTPLTIDAVLIAAQPGHGKRAGLFTDYTFAVWDGENLVPVAKAYSGLTDAEIRAVDRFVREQTLGRFGPVRSVTAELVFELHFEGVQISGRHKSGVALRFPRIARWRTDKPFREADTLETLKALAAKQSHSAQNDDPEILQRAKQMRLFEE